MFMKGKGICLVLLKVSNQPFHLSLLTAKAGQSHSITIHVYSGEEFHKINKRQLWIFLTKLSSSRYTSFSVYTACFSFSLVIRNHFVHNSSYICKYSVVIFHCTSLKSDVIGLHEDNSVILTQLAYSSAELHFRPTLASLVTTGKELLTSSKDSLVTTVFI